MKIFIKEFFHKLSRTKVMAINGCMNIQSLIEFLNLEENSKIKKLFYSDIYEEYNGLEHYISANKLANKTIIILDIIRLKHENIVKVFRDLCDKINYQNILDSSESLLIVAGNWDMNSLTEKLKVDGVSNHFNEGNNLLYSIDLRIENKDFDLYKKGTYREKRKENWEYILDFSKGEIFSTWFLSEKIFDQESLYQKNKTVQSNCNNFMSFFQDLDLWNELKEKFKDYKHIHSFKTRTDLPEYDLIKRSNLFKLSSRVGDNFVFKTNHYLSRYTLYNLGKVEPNISYHPQFPILRKHMLIAEEVLDIEKEVKHVLKNYFTIKRIDIHLIPMKISWKGNIYTFNKNQLDNSLSEMVKQSDSLKPEIKNYINLLTFGGLIRLMTELEDMYTIIQEFDIGRHSEAVINNNNIFKLEKESENDFRYEENSVKLTLRRGDLVHLNKMSFKKKTTIITVIRKDQAKYEHYYVRSDVIKNQISETGFSISYLDYNREKDSQHTSLFKNYGEIKTLLNELRGFRNAVLHNRAIDSSEFDNFDKAIAKFYELTAIN